MDDDELFGAEMSDVKPLNREPRERIVKTSMVDHSVRRAAAVDSASSRDRNSLVDDGVEPLDAWYTLEFKRPGIQNGVYRKLRLGHYDIEARLDLHGMRRDDAHGELNAFLSWAQARGLRCLLVITGKGRRTPLDEERSVLKALLPRWLNEPTNRNRILAFAHARPQHGGEGAFYVLLRKGHAR